MKLSVRNVMPGTCIGVSKGATTSVVKIEVSPGIIMTASITNESVDSLGIAAGKPATAIVKASDVMVGVD